MMYSGTQKLGELFTLRKECGREGLPTLAVTINDGLVERNGIERKMETNLSAEEHLLVCEGDIAYNMMRMWQGASGRANQDGLISPAYVVYAPLDGIDSKYAAHLFKSSRIVYLFWAYSYGITGDRLRLYPRDFEKIPVEIPRLDEQAKIASILSTWDRAIEKTEALIEAKEQRKKGLMQRLLTGKVRFGEFAEEEWKEVPLGELFEQVTDTVGDQDIPPYSISAGIGFVSQREKWGKDIAGRQYSKYTHLREGEFAYNKGNSKKYQCGCAYLLRGEESISVPNVFISFRKKSDAVCADFYEHFFVADYHARELKRYITSGARSDGLLNLNKKDFFKIKVPCPSGREQEAIAKVLNTAVAEIAEHRSQLEALKEQKKGLMQQLLTGKVRVKGELG